VDEMKLTQLDETLAGYAARGDVSGLAWAVVHRGEVHTGAAGTLVVDGAPVRTDSIFRISSMTKPVTAVAALMLVEAGVLELDAPVDPYLPELADRRVLANPAGPIEDTVPATRPITLRDVLTFRLGYGMDFAAWDQPQPVLSAAAELGLGSGPPAPAGPPAPDEWIRRLGTLPLSHQPGERWLYHTGADVLGVLIARAAGRPFEQFLHERIFEPLGMVDTGFSVPAADLARFGACYVTDPESGERHVYDAPDGQWSRPPAFPSGGAGLVSTVVDYVRFAELLRNGGVYGSTRLLDVSTVQLMTTDHLTDAQRTTAGPDPSGSQGWGFCVGVQVRATPAHAPGSYGWDGGLGSSWANDPAAELAGVLLTTQMWNSPVPPAVCDAFWTAAYAATAD
jgi:CubicO group peptidase (beta-lactamase class C family)